MGATSIEWTKTYHADGTVSPGFSVNPIRARLRDAAHAALTKGGYGSGVGHYCEKLSEGCALCYASTSQPRFGMPEFPGARKSLVTLPVLDERGAVPATDKVELFFDDAQLQEVLRRRKPTRFFWCDQTDIAGSWVPDEWMDRCFATMALTPWHTHQVLTKRIDRMAAYLNTPGVAGRISAAPWTMKLPHHLATKYIVHDPPSPEMSAAVAKVMQQVDPDGSKAAAIRASRRQSWPLPNVWIGTSVEKQEWADRRIGHLLACPAKVIFLSLEPLLGPVVLPEEFLGPNFADDDPRATKRWAIVGGESGPGARPMHPDWVRSLRDQCQDFGVPFFFKQWGGWKPSHISAHSQKDHDAGRACIISREGKKVPGQGVGDAVMAHVGKGAAGRLLDGRVWNEFPDSSDRAATRELAAAQGG